MYVRQIAIGAMLIVLVCTPGFALAQGATGHWLLHDPRGRVPFGDRRIGWRCRIGDADRRHDATDGGHDGVHSRWIWLVP